ncbi:MAG: UDP-glucose 4-epimerase GalE [Nevskiales bacterium]
MNSKPAALVLGGAGYIGSHVCRQLSLQGFQPVSYDNLSTGHEWAVRWGPLVRADTSDFAALQEALQRFDVHAVVHLAASIEVGESVQNPLKYYDNNVARSLNLLRAVQGSAVKAIVFSSTAAVYGNPLTSAITENHPLWPTSPYGWSKLFVERMLEDQANAGGIGWCSLRYFNACGAEPEHGIGEAHPNETHLIPRACMALQGVIPPLQIYGNDYPTPDGTAIRDYIHVADLAHAHVLALRRLLEGGSSLSLNLGIGRGYSVKDVIAAAAKVSGRAVPHDIGPRRPGDVAVLVADASLARSTLGWVPSRIHLEDMIESALRWHESGAGHASG